MVLCFLGCSIGMMRQGKAQILNPFGTGYFQDQYLSNPAMAGVSFQTLDLNAGYRKEGTSVPGAPGNQYLTGTYGITDKVGVGLNVYHDQAGLLNTTRAMATYAYHVSLNKKNSKLLLGISAGMLDMRIDHSAINGDQDDPGITKFNDRGLRFDADFGAAFTNGRLTVQGAFPGMVTYFRKDQNDVIDRTVFFSAVSYELSLNKDNHTIGLEPKICYRGIKGYDNILDAGADVSFLDNLFDVFGMYHSSKSATFGAGVNIKKKLNITAVYATGAAALKSYTNGTFEVGVGLRLGRPFKKAATSQ
jgi:type IX secretion system PorP/SprF family membrane protein